MSFEWHFPKESTMQNSHFFFQDGVTYDVYKLIEYSKNIKPVRMEIADLDEALDEELWLDNNGQKFRPKKILKVFKHYGNWEEILTAYPMWGKHIRSIRTANYEKYPILVHDYRIIDGMHRLVKAVIDGATDIDVKILDKLPEDTINNNLYKR